MWDRPVIHMNGKRRRALIGDVFRASTIFGLAIIVASCADVGAIEAGSNIGSTEIDNIIRRQGYNPGRDFNTEHSPLSNGIREYLVERAKQGGVAAVDLALSCCKGGCLCQRRPGLLQCALGCPGDSSSRPLHLVVWGLHVTGVWQNSLQLKGWVCLAPLPPRVEQSARAGSNPTQGEQS